jgi:hypothetical protein
LAGAEQAGGTAPLNPEQLDEVDLPLVGRPVEPGDLLRAEVGALVEDNPGGLVAVDAAVLGECIGEQFAGVGLTEVGLPVALGDLGGSPRTTTPSPRSLTTWATAVCSSSPSGVR